MLSENGDVIKRHDRAPDHSTVSIQNGGPALPSGPSGLSLDQRCSVDVNFSENGAKALLRISGRGLSLLAGKLFQRKSVRF